MRFSAIIPHKPGIADREVIWRYNEKRWKELMPDVELIVGENSDDPFNKSAAVNDAASKSSGEYLIICDSDIFFGSRLISLLDEVCNNYPWIIPYSRSIRLNKDYVKSMEDSGAHTIPSSLKSSDLERQDIQLRVQGDYILVVSRDKFFEVGGMDERFQGWGYSVSALATTLNCVYGQPFILDYTIFHCEHEKAPKDHIMAESNSKLFNLEYYNAPRLGDIQRIISEKQNPHLKR
jgi:predicted glycosyltransferase involved in capsule biosynthesis